MRPCSENREFRGEFGRPWQVRRAEPKAAATSAALGDLLRFSVTLLTPKRPRGKSPRPFRSRFRLFDRPRAPFSTDWPIGALSARHDARPTTSQSTISLVSGWGPPRHTQVLISPSEFTMLSRDWALRMRFVVYSGTGPQELAECHDSASLALEAVSGLLAQGAPNVRVLNQAGESVSLVGGGGK
jgi:hypothetical protein